MLKFVFRDRNAPAEKTKQKEEDLSDYSGDLELFTSPSRFSDEFFSFLPSLTVQSFLQSS